MSAAIAAPGGRTIPRHHVGMSAPPVRVSLDCPNHRGKPRAVAEVSFLGDGAPRLRVAEGQGRVPRLTEGEEPGTAVPSGGTRQTLNWRPVAADAAVSLRCRESDCDWNFDTDAGRLIALADGARDLGSDRFELRL